MKNLIHCFPANDDRGSALITTILILLVVTIIGIMASRTADMELQIAGHDKFHKMAWFATDAAVDGIIPGLLEQALEERLQEGDDLEAIFPVFSSSLTTENYGFYKSGETGVCGIDTPDTTNADIVLASEAMGKTDVYLKSYGAVGFMDGSAIQLPEGYHGFGKGLAKGGSQIVFTIRGLGVSASTNAEARILSRWRYVIH